MFLENVKDLRGTLFRQMMIFSFTAYFYLSSVCAQSISKKDTLVADQGLDSYISRVEAILPQARKHVQAYLHLEVPSVTIYISKNKDIMLKKATHHHRGIPPQWAAGLAYPRTREIYVPALPEGKMLPLLQHELVHIALGHVKLPLWMNEGLSVLIGDGLSWERMWTLNEAAIQGSLLRFSQLTQRFPESGLPANVAYAQSAHFLSYLRSNYGEKRFSQWLKAIFGGEQIESASKKHLENELWQLERGWKQSLKQGMLAWLSLLFKPDNIWAVAILFFLFYGRRKLQKRKYTKNTYEKPLEGKVAQRFQGLTEATDSSAPIFNLAEPQKNLHNQDRH